jgi:hypothetical protein
MRLDEPIQVEAVLDGRQRLSPRSFVVGGTRYTVHQIGRRWDDGEWQHNLVMSPDGQTWDLAFSGSLGAWRLKSHTTPRGGRLA